MGPLVPDVISNNLNFIVAFVIGILFGAILEQAGFSTSKKLVGLFYGYDFTVLRVFFTAGIVAMIGVLIFDHFGLLDMSLVYINPTYFLSAVIGGFIMGLGFVIGGFCPGTSICAAAIGKIDAMIFIIGAFIGVFIFAEGYPLFEELYKATYWGNPQMFDTLGISQSLFAFIMVFFALFSFFIVSIIENKVNRIKKPAIRFTPYYISLAVVGLLLAISAFIFPDRKASLIKATENEAYVNSYTIDTMSVDELAYRLMDETDKELQIFDFRSEKEFLEFSLPKSNIMTLDNLFEKEPNKLLRLKNKINLFIADDEATAKRMAIIANELGIKRIAVLSGGLNAFKENILNFKPTKEPTSFEEKFTYRFRTEASQVLLIIIEQNKSKGPAKKESKRVVGGC